MRTQLLLGAAAVLALALPVPSQAPAPPVAVPAPAEAYRRTAAAMRDAGGAYRAWAAGGRQFLSFDPAGDGTAVEVVGDLAAADRVVILVPGVDTTLKDFDRGLGGVARRAPAVQARAIYRQLRYADPAAHVAVVAWLGYDPPDGLGLDAVREGRARTGAAALTSFVHGVHALRPSAGLTLVGHSYGAIVVGLAAPRLPEVADLVVLGAPGMGARRAADLGGARVWSALAAADWIRRVPQIRFFGLGHGRRPSDPHFGARPLPAEGVAGHDWYLSPGSVTLAALSAVALGQPALRHAAPDQPAPSGAA